MKISAKEKGDKWVYTMEMSEKDYLDITYIVKRVGEGVLPMTLGRDVYESLEKAILETKYTTRSYKDEHTE